MPYVLGPIEPAGNFAGVQDVDLGGGYRVVADHAVRNAIPIERRVVGMVVYTQSDARTWRLNPDLNTWTLIQSGTSVTSVLGRTGDVVAQPGDYTLDQIAGMLDAQRVADGSVTNAEFQQLAGVADSIQLQLDTKALASHTHPLSQFGQSGAVSGQSPVWNGTAWQPQTVTSDELPFDYRLSRCVIEHPTYQLVRSAGTSSSKQYGSFQSQSVNGRRWSVFFSSSSVYKVYAGISNYDRYQTLAGAYFIMLTKAFNVAENPIFVGFNKYPPYVDPPAGYDVVGFRTVLPGNWQLIMQNASGERWTQTTDQTVTPDTVYKFLILKTAAGVYEFYINGTKIGDTASAGSGTYPNGAAEVKPYCVMDVVGGNTYGFGVAFIRLWS